MYLSEWLVPLMIFYIVGFGILSKRPVFDDFLKGAAEGIKTVFGVLPTLVGLMTAIGVLRTSGFLAAVSEVLKIPAGFLQIPVELVPVILTRMISNSAATGLVLDIFKSHGPDSVLGNTASIIMGSTETIFYTMSVYFMTAKIKKTRYTLLGALLATLAGIVASVWLGS